jgi:hypothetical protein
MKKIATKTRSHKGTQRKFIKIFGVLVPWWLKTTRRQNEKMAEKGKNHLPNHH